MSAHASSTALPVRSLSHDLRRLWAPDTELRQRMLDDHRRLIAACLMVIGPLSLAFWCWDWANDPVGAQQTWLPRLFYLLLIPTGWLTLRLRRPTGVGLLLIFSLAWTIALYCLVLTRLAGGMQFGFAGYLTFYFFALIILAGLSLRWTLLYALLTPLIPHLLGLSGALPGFPHLAFALLLWPMSLCTVLLYTVAAQNYLRRYELERLLEQASNTDPLTGISNRRHFMPALQREIRRARRQHLALAVLMIDIDHFKRINDGHGHACGDRVIREMAQICRQGSRDIDLVARFGGEEFALLLPGTPLSQALAMAERLRQLAEQAQILQEQGAALRFTVSIGAAVLGPGDGDGETLLARADNALYEAKRMGRNRVCAEAPQVQA